VVVQVAADHGRREGNLGQVLRAGDRVGRMTRFDFGSKVGNFYSK
jgi:hypothetical protein